MSSTILTNSLLKVISSCGWLVVRGSDPSRGVGVCHFFFQNGSGAHLASSLVVTWV